MPVTDVKIMLCTKDEGVIELRQSLLILPRESEHIFFDGKRYVVAQVQHHLPSRIPHDQSFTIVATPA